MANPFLVLGGIAVGIVTAAFGILQAPGWVTSAQDATAMNDVALVSDAEAAALSAQGRAYDSVAALNASGSGVDIAVSTGTCIAIDIDGKDWVLAVRSESGNWFARVNGGEIGKSELLINAVNAAGGLVRDLQYPDTSHCDPGADEPVKLEGRLAGVRHLSSSSMIFTDVDGRDWAMGEYLDNDGNISSSPGFTSFNPDGRWAEYDSDSDSAENGNLYAAAIDKAGRLWTWGANSQGQLGNGTRTSVRTPTQVRPDLTFTNVLTYQQRTWALDTSGQLWVVGWNSPGVMDWQAAGDVKLSKFKRVGGDGAIGTTTDGDLVTVVFDPHDNTFTVHTAPAPTGATFTDVHSSPFFAAAQTSTGDLWSIPMSDVKLVDGVGQTFIRWDLSGMQRVATNDPVVSVGTDNGILHVLTSSGKIYTLNSVVLGMYWGFTGEPVTPGVDAKLVPVPDTSIPNVTVPGASLMLADGYIWSRTSMGPDGWTVYPLQPPAS